MYYKEQQQQMYKDSVKCLNETNCMIIVDFTEISLFQHTSIKFRFFNLTVISISAFKHTINFTHKINFHDISQRHDSSYLKLQEYQFC